VIILRRSFLAANLAWAVERPEPPDDWQAIRRVVAVGDIHGDKDALAAVLTMAGVVDEQEHWAGAKTHLVQTGDIPARGPQTRKAFDFLMRLEKEAEAAGGKVHALIGNHDAGVIHGDHRSILAEEYGEFRTSDSEALLSEAFEKELASRKRAGRMSSDPAEPERFRKFWFEMRPPGYVEHRRAFGPSGPYGGWIRRNNAVIRINDTLFLHGGISPKYAGRTRSSMNRAVRRELADPERYLPGIVTDPQGPLWYRGLVEDAGPAIEPHLQQVLRFHGVRRIVVGHTVTRSVILPSFGGRVVNIDLGLSRFYGRPPACLVLEPRSAYVLHRGTKIPLPGPGPGSQLDYLRAVEAADEQPSPATKLIRDLESNR
jgi:3',5'-cyclic AMP phosphodiesterase CpdA